MCSHTRLEICATQLSALFWQRKESSIQECSQCAKGIPQQWLCAKQSQFKQTLLLLACFLLQQTTLMSSGLYICSPLLNRLFYPQQDVQCKKSLYKNPLKPAVWTFKPTLKDLSTISHEIFQWSFSSHKEELGSGGPQLSQKLWTPTLSESSRIYLFLHKAFLSVLDPILLLYQNHLMNEVGNRNFSAVILHHSTNSNVHIKANTSMFWENLFKADG